MSEYEKRGLIKLDQDGCYFIKHMEAMTAENLKTKSDIAAELAWRGREIDNLKDIIQRLGGE